MSGPNMYPSYRDEDAVVAFSAALGAFGFSRMNNTVRGEQPDELALPVDGAMRGDAIPSHEPEHSGGAK